MGLIIKRRKNQKVYIYDNDTKIMEVSALSPVKLHFEALPHIRIVRDDAKVTTKKENS